MNEEEEIIPSEEDFQLGLVITSVFNSITSRIYDKYKLKTIFKRTKSETEKAVSARLYFVSINKEMEEFNKTIYIPVSFLNYGETTQLSICINGTPVYNECLFAESNLVTRKNNHKITKRFTKKIFDMYSRFMHEYNLINTDKASNNFTDKTEIKTIQKETTEPLKEIKEVEIISRGEFANGEPAVMVRITFEDSTKIGFAMLMKDNPKDLVGKKAHFDADSGLTILDRNSIN